MPLNNGTSAATPSLAKSGKCKLSAKDFGSARAYYEARAERKSDCSDAGDAKSKKLSPKEFQKQQKLRQREKAREASRKKDLERAARIAAIQAEKAAQQERKALFDELPEEMPEAPSYLQATYSQEHDVRNATTDTQTLSDATFKKVDAEGPEKTASAAPSAEATVESQHIEEVTETAAFPVGVSDTITADLDDGKHGAALLFGTLRSDKGCDAQVLASELHSGDATTDDDGTHSDMMPEQSLNSEVRDGPGPALLWGILRSDKNDGKPSRPAHEDEQAGVEATGRDAPIESVERSFPEPNAASMQLTLHKREISMETHYTSESTTMDPFTSSDASSAHPSPPSSLPDYESSCESDGDSYAPPEPTPPMPEIPAEGIQDVTAFMRGVIAHLTHRIATLEDENLELGNRLHRVEQDNHVLRQQAQTGFREVHRTQVRVDELTNGLTNACRVIEDESGKLAEVDEDLSGAIGRLTTVEARLRERRRKGHVEKEEEEQRG